MPPVKGKGKKKAGTVPLRRVAKPSEADVQGFLEDLDVELESRCQVIQLKADFLVDSLRNKFKAEMIKLPKAIRTMNAKSFCENFGGDISLVLQQGSQVAAQPMAPTSTRKVRARNNVPRTPVSSQFDSRLPCTPATAIALRHTVVNKSLRQARRGESLVSLNGSPVVPSSFNAGKSAFEIPSNIDLSAFGDSETAFSKLAALKDQVSELMEQCNTAKMSS